MNVQRTASQRSVREDRPGITRRASKRDAEAEAINNPQMFRDRYEQYPFADPPKQRAYGLGPQIYTTEHKRLVQRLRDENARQAQDLAESRRDLASARHMESVRYAEQTLLEQEMRRLQTSNSQLLEQLQETTDSLDALDAAHRAQQSKRRSFLVPKHEEGKAEIVRISSVSRPVAAALVRQ